MELELRYKSHQTKKMNGGYKKIYTSNVNKGRQLVYRGTNVVVAKQAAVRQKISVPYIVLYEGKNYYHTEADGYPKMFLKLECELAPL